MMQPRRAVITFLFAIALHLSASAQALLSPPFGLKWGDNPSALMDWADREKLDITIKLSGTDRNQRHIIISKKNATLPGQQASSLEARYERNRLYDVTIHYDDPSLTVHQSKSKFLNAKKALTARHGPFKPTNNFRKSKNSFTTQSLSYHVEPVSGLFVMITYTEITDQLRQTAKSKFSLIYRNDNLSK